MTKLLLVCVAVVSAVLTVGFYNFILGDLEANRCDAAELELESIEGRKILYETEFEQAFEYITTRQPDRYSLAQKHLDNVRFFEYLDLYNKTTLMRRAFVNARRAFYEQFPREIYPEPFSMSHGQRTPISVWNEFLEAHGYPTEREERSRIIYHLFYYDFPRRDLLMAPIATEEAVDLTISQIITFEERIYEKLFLLKKIDDNEELELSNITKVEKWEEISASFWELINHLRRDDRIISDFKGNIADMVQMNYALAEQCALIRWGCPDREHALCAF